MEQGVATERKPLRCDDDDHDDHDDGGIGGVGVGDRRGCGGEAGGSS